MAKIKTSLSESSCHISGEVKDLERSLSCSTEVLCVFSCFLFPIAFSACLFSFLLPDTTIDTARAFAWDQENWVLLPWTDNLGRSMGHCPWLQKERNQQSKCIYLDKLPIFKRNHLSKMNDFSTVLVQKVREVYSWHPWNFVLLMGLRVWC